MKNSQKGMKLNEARYFRQPRPYTRKRITKMRLIPDLSGLNGSVHSSPKDRLPLSPYPRISERSRDRCTTLDCDQPSREIAWISYTSDSEDMQDVNFAQGQCRDRYSETDQEREIVVSLPEAADSVSKKLEVEHLEIKPEVEKEVQVEFEIEVEETKVEREKEVEDPKPEGSLKPEVLLKSEGQKPEVPAKPEVVDEPKAFTTTEDRRNKSENCSSKNTSFDSERSIWWRYSSIRKILDFFGNLLGKRASGEREKEVPKTDQRTQIVDTTVDVSRNSEPNSKKSSSPTKMSRTKRSSKRKNLTTRKNAVAIKQPDDRIVSGLTRQIMNTRDKRLRATLLEHEMRTRKLEEENRRYKRILEDKLKTRQMSSPLH